MGQTEKNKCKLASMFTLNFGYFLVELIVGYMCNSMALVADSFHMLSDVAALIVAFYAVKMSPRKWAKNTFGYARAEVLGALVNAVFLIALCFTIVVDSIMRIMEPAPIKDPKLVFIVGGIGLLMNLVGLCIFSDHGHKHGHSHGTGNRGTVTRKKSALTHGNRLTRMVSNVETEEVSDDDVSQSANNRCDERNNCTRVEDIKSVKKSSVTILVMDKNMVDGEGDSEATTNPTKRESSIRFQSRENLKKVGGADQMNIHGVFLHVLADTMGSVIVVVSALLVWLVDMGVYGLYIDPVMSILMVMLILASVYPLLLESSMILLQSVPSHIDMEELESKLLKQIDGVIGIHELHVWQLAGDRIIATAHIKCRTLQEYFHIAEKVKAVFHNEGIHSTTIQPEFSQQVPEVVKKGELDCYLSCSALSTTTNCSGSTCCPPATANGPPVESHDNAHHHGKV